MLLLPPPLPAPVVCGCLLSLLSCAWGQMTVRKGGREREKENGGRKEGGKREGGIVKAAVPEIPDSSQVLFVSTAIP